MGYMKYSKRKVERIANLVEVIDNIGFGHNDFDYDQGVNIMRTAARAINNGIGAIMFGENHYSGALTVWVLYDNHISAFLYNAENKKVTIWIDGIVYNDDTDVIYEMNENDVEYAYDDCDDARYLIDIFNEWKCKFL